MKFLLWDTLISSLTDHRRVRALEEAPNNLLFRLEEGHLILKEAGTCTDKSYVVLEHLPFCPLEKCAFFD
ncbi:Hypothetical protein FKW44_014434 [Caligus rogercresseyi]|uniref:Uncharacterized protein n=1 Tax=Caligus rogercresseyi TaxID=217165 RepID=A0A7T8GYW2_CALRO|nr:Hypothetical protein FKW44_014434 [Caligus rogercresseyi]